MAGNLFPYDAPRKGQADFLRDSRTWLGKGGILLAQAPTGLGKTAVALAAGLEVARGEEGRKVLFTTARRSQHRIAVETARLIHRLHAPVPTVDLIAREAMCGPNHADHHGEGTALRPVARTILRRPLHAQEVAGLARRFRVCPYRACLTALRRANLIVCDYNHLFDPSSEGVLRSAGIHRADIVCIVDEAHNLPPRVRESLSHGLTAEGLARLAGVARSKSGAAQFAALSRLLATEARFVGGDSRVPPEFLDRFLARSSLLPRWRTRIGLVRQLERLAPSLSQEDRLRAQEAIAFLQSWEEAHYLRLLSRQNGGSLLLSALDPQLATRGVFRRMHAALLMSGTLHPGAMYVDLLGLEPGRTRTREYLPNFPPQNRLLLAARGLSLAYRKRPRAFRLCAREIGRLCRVIPGNVAAFFPSYDVARKVGEALKAFSQPKQPVWEHRGQTKAVKEGLIQMLQIGREGHGRLLMAVQGGSLSEGIDYPGNLLSGVIVVGLAMSPPDLRVEALRSFYADRFGRRQGFEYAYLYPALNRAVQSAGRCIRGERDVAAVVILDDRILRPSVRARLPRSFRPRPSWDVAAEVRTFFYVGQHESPRAPPSGGRGPHHTDPVARASGRGEASSSKDVSPSGP